MNGLEAFDEMCLIFGDTNSLEGTYKYALQTRKDLKMLLLIKREIGMELYDICKRRLEISTNANRGNLEKIIEFLKREEKYDE